MKAFEIATASKRNVALALGLEDYTADLGVQRTQQARESFFARTAVVMLQGLPDCSPSTRYFLMWAIWKHLNRPCSSRNRWVLSAWDAFTHDKCQW